MCEHHIFPVTVRGTFDGTVIVNAMPFGVMTDTSHRQSRRTKWNTLFIDLLCRARLLRIVSRYHPMTEEYQTARLLFDIVTRLAFPVAGPYLLFFFWS